MAAACIYLGVIKRNLKSAECCTVHSSRQLLSVYCVLYGMLFLVTLHGECIHFVVVLMGKNTMMRKAIRGYLEENPALEK